MKLMMQQFAKIISLYIFIYDFTTAKTYSRVGLKAMGHLPSLGGLDMSEKAGYNFLFIALNK